MLGRHGAGADVQIEAGDEGLEGGDLAAEALALGVLAVEEGPLLVLLAPVQVIEGPHVAERLGDRRGLGGEGEGHHLRAAGADLGALQRTVVHEDEAVEAEAQLGGQGHQVLRLGTPVDPVGEDMLSPQRHLRVSVEDLEDVGLVVLAAEAEQHPPLLLLHQELLQEAARRVDLHAGGADLARDALPQGLVAVEDDHLVRRAEDARQPPHDGGGEGREIEGRVGDVPFAVGVRVVEVRDRVERFDLGEGQQVNGARARQRRRHGALQPVKTLGQLGLGEGGRRRGTRTTR